MHDYVYSNLWILYYTLQVRLEIYVFTEDMFMIVIIRKSF